MPYYCTVPRCTSMAGKAKNVSFHQFPRDEELAKLWNNILKRGKPYTKYSKVCSLHFKPEDYTITSAGKNKGQWRTLRKDAIPSQKLPSDSPAPYTRRQSDSWVPVPTNVPAIDPQIRQQAQNLAQAIYMRTVLAMQVAGVQEPMGLTMCNDQPQPKTGESSPPHPNTSTTPALDQEAESNHKEHDNQSPTNQVDTINHLHRTNHDNQEIENRTSFQCDDCSKCFKDPDVFVLHKRTHQKDELNGKGELNGKNELNGKENFDLNTLKPEMLKSNPILANLLKNTMERNIFTKNLYEKQLMVSFSNMENYLRSVTDNYDEDCDNSDLSESLDDSNLVIDENLA